MGFSLDLPNEEATKQELVQETAVKPEVMEQIDANVKNNADAIFAVNLDNFKDKKEITNVIENFGTDLIQKSTKSSALMQTRAKDLSRVGGESGQVADTLEKLSIEVRGLDPAQVDFNNDGLLAKIANPVKRYFAKYKTADAQIADIIDELKKGEKILKNDNVTLEMEQQNAKELVAQLTEKAKLGEQLDQYLTGQLETYKAGSDYNEDKARFVEEEILFPLRQRCLDFQQIIAVEQQSYVAMEIIRKNNLELVRSVDRAESVTVTALRTAVMVASALYHQKIVLDKVNAINNATNSLIASTSRMLNTQGVEIQQQAVSASINIDTMKQAFTDTFEALDAINTYKQEALPQMKQTIDAFSELAAEGEKKMAQIEKGNAQAAEFQKELNAGSQQTK